MESEQPLTAMLAAARGGPGRVLSHIGALFGRTQKASGQKRKLSDREEEDEEEDGEEEEVVVEEQAEEKGTEKEEAGHKESSEGLEDIGQSSKPETKPKRKAERKQANSASDEPVTDEAVALEKARCTVFVGNVPVSAITNKSDYSRLKALFSPMGRIESIRFRSIAFSDMLPRKAAFLEGRLHEGRSTVNAYIVYRERASVPRALELNGQVWMNRHLRVDSVAHPARQEPRRCVFVGNVAFDAEEEALWRHFSSAGRVEYVRIVRDAATNVGKGFAYVQFYDAADIDKALLLDGKTVTDGGEKPRKLRVTQAKSTKKLAKRNGGGPGKKPQGRERKLLGKAGAAKKAGSGGSSAASSNSSKPKVIEGERAQPASSVPNSRKRKSKERAKAWKASKKAKKTK